MERWLILADDVTGALDSAVGFAGTGLVEYGVTLPVHVDVASVSTGSRAKPTHDWETDDRFDRDAVDRLFVKIDSTLRGWPGEHVRTALAWWGPSATAVICPAAPALGRTVTDGRVLVHGTPAAQTAAGADPVAPTREDRLPVLFDAPLVDLADLPGAIGHHPAVVVDAATQADLDALAAVIEAAGPRAVPVGASGLAAALGARRSPRQAPGPRAARVVVVVTSVHPVSRAQIDALEVRVPIVSPPALDIGTVTHEQAVVIARATADRAAEHVHRDADTAVVVIGGDGTDALLSALGAEGVEVLGSVLPGVPWGRIRGGRADGTTIVTKSGGFGDADTLNAIIRTLTKDEP
ncbi:four-carbon acid sugar kinase family protein [Curtobacterium sp. MCBD17_019]|uniref:four-carbon acid sugar kinase family protein n=1 Tax=Curtobacterium sp. MCBD17_019 TaxID=2175669 RepID=UPI000DA94F64|nr:four-carbon acid sugar kinase family protein [Curtobacterium sp. MCBD17_019]PZE76605.1 hypothetical protein DEI82_05425 [Curtobacterium sp. MCBD17_019]